MLKFSFLALAGVLCLAASNGCSNPPNAAPTAKEMAQGDMVQIAGDDAAMNAALAKGNATLPQFRAALSKPTPAQADFAVYARFSENGRNEYLWLEPVALSGPNFRGRINNAPAMLTGVKLGQTVTIPAKDIGDWMYIENGKLVGGQTSRVLRDQMGDAERAEFDRSLPYRFD